MREDLQAKLERYQEALNILVEKLREDRYVLAAVLLGSLTEQLIWKREAIGLWIIEADGVSRRHRSDGNDERLFRTLAVNDVNFQAEMIPRGRFKRMVEGSSRTAFEHSFFAHRRLLYTHDESIERWFEDANRLAVKDQRRELLSISAWIVHPLRHAERLLEHKEDHELTRQELLGATWGLAFLEIVRAGDVVEDDIVEHARQLNPELFGATWDVLVGKPDAEGLQQVINTISGHLEGDARNLFKSLLTFLKKERRNVALSEIGDHFAFTQLYPWHLESSCEWLSRQGFLEKLAAPYRLTTKSRVELEEPAYMFMD